jgi:hypothetical protein
VFIAFIWNETFDIAQIQANKINYTFFKSNFFLSSLHSIESFLCLIQN